MKIINNYVLNKEISFSAALCTFRQFPEKSTIRTLTHVQLTKRNVSEKEFYVPTLDVAPFKLLPRPAEILVRGGDVTDAVVDL